MTKSQLLKKIAYLESINDHLSTEISHLDQLMHLIGFSSGLATVKATAKEMLEKGLEIIEPDFQQNLESMEQNEENEQCI